MQGIVFTLLHWGGRIETAMRAGFRARPILTTAAAAGVLALPLLVLPIMEAMTLWMLVLSLLVPFYIIRILRWKDGKLADLNAQEAHRQRRKAPGRFQSDLKKTYGPGRRR